MLNSIYKIICLVFLFCNRVNYLFLNFLIFWFFIVFIFFTNMASVAVPVYISGAEARKANVIYYDPFEPILEHCYILNEQYTPKPNGTVPYRQYINDASHVPREKEWYKNGKEMANSPSTKLSLTKALTDKQSYVVQSLLGADGKPDKAKTEPVQLLATKIALLGKDVPKGEPMPDPTSASTTTTTTSYVPTLPFNERMDGIVYEVKVKKLFHYYLNNFREFNFFGL